MRRLMRDATVASRKAELSNARDVLTSQKVSWNKIYVAHAEPGRTEEGMLIGMLDQAFMILREEDVLAERDNLKPNAAKDDRISITPKGRPTSRTRSLLVPKKWERA